MVAAGIDNRYMYISFYYVRWSRAWFLTFHLNLGRWRHIFSIDHDKDRTDLKITGDGEQ